MSNSDDNKFGVLLEHMSSQMQAVLEAVGDIRQKVIDQPIRDEFNELREDVKTITAAVSDQSTQQLHDLEHDFRHHVHA